MRCGSCQFYFREREQCRRHPPAYGPALPFHNSELLRDIAWSLRTIAKIDLPEKEDKFDELNREATEENWLDDRWPYTDTDDFCGEFKEKPQA